MLCAAADDERPRPHSDDKPASERRTLGTRALLQAPLLEVKDDGPENDALNKELDADCEIPLTGYQADDRGKKDADEQEDGP